MSTKMKYIIIGVVIVLVGVSVFVSISKYRYKHRDVLKDTAVTVTVDLTDAPATVDDEGNEIVDPKYAEIEEEVGKSDASVPYVSSKDRADSSEVYEEPAETSETETIETDKNTETEENVEDNVEENENISEEALEAFSYTELTASNYVNFMEQLCSVDFKSMQTEHIPLSDSVRSRLEEQGCVNGDALTYSFITEDNGFNDENNSFYVILHLLDEQTTYLYVTGKIKDNKLDSISVEAMR